ncbi:MAG TPA: CheR family methyltransferase [Dongiaceae bacterium]|nr:CheR family methyltransferase [Dongiaceae bacterium]
MRNTKLADPMNLAPFKELMLRTCGHSFEKDREQALSASLGRRMAARGIAGHDEYFSLLLRDCEELRRLTEMLTVNETYFFREPEHLNLMVEKLLPEFMVARNQRPVRILSAGCSTGEEPYSIAILLRERFGTESERLFTITGVDIDSNVIASAKQGVYGRGSFRGMDRSLLERYFEPCGSDRFQVMESIRKLVGFEVVNLLNASYPHRMQQPDIILYRNVSIYFPGQVQREIFGKLAELLAEDGCLLVGATETIHHDIGILSLVKQDSLFYYRKTPPLLFEERRTSGRHTSSPERASREKAQRAPVKRLTGGHLPPPTGNPDKRSQASKQSDVRELFDAAVELAHNSQHDKALGILNAIIKLDSTFEKAYTLMGSLLLSASRLDEARDVCESILARDALCLEAYLMLGITSRQNGDYDGAIKRFREAIYLDTNCWLAHFYTAEILFAQQDEKRARSSFETAVSILEKGSLHEHGRAFFPLSFNAEQFIVICRHKLSLLTPTGGTSSPQKTRKAISSAPRRNG